MQSIQWEPLAQAIAKSLLVLLLGSGVFGAGSWTGGSRVGIESEQLRNTVMRGLSASVMILEQELKDRTDELESCLNREK